MAFLTGRAIHSRRLLLGALLGVVALSAAPGKASAQIPPLDALNTVGNILGIGRPQPPQERPNNSVMNGNLHSNDIDFCVLTCDLPSNLIPMGQPPIPTQARPPVPTQARPPVPTQARPPIPPQARPPIPPQARPPVPTQAPPAQGPTILLPPIQL